MTPPLTATPFGHYAPPAVGAPRNPGTTPWGRLFVTVRRAGAAGLPEAAVTPDEAPVVARLLEVGVLARALRNGTPVLLAVSPRQVRRD